MSHTNNTRFTSVIPTHVTPIVCPHCSGIARLTRRFESVSSDDKGEIRSFECDGCKKQIDMFIRD